MSLDALDRLMKTLGTFIKEIGFPVAVTAYLLLRLDVQMQEITRATEEINTRLLVILTERVPHLPRNP